MARRKKDTETETAKNIVTSDKDLDKAFKVIDDMNEDATMLSETPLSDVNDWISTGCYALNAIISGNCYKGIPSGRVTGFYGLQACGKTLLLNTIVANAQKKGYSRTVYFDSETALDKMCAERLGCDITQIKHAPVELIEDCRNQVIALLTKLIEMGAKRKVVIVIDSLGNLSTRKELTDAQNNHDAADMGLRAKTLSSMMRLITYRAAKIEAPVLFSNHIYENPSALYPTLIKKQAGGLKPLFIASVLVQLSVSNNKAADDKNGEASRMSDKITGVNLTALTAKNRFVPPFISASDIELNFRTGLNKYSGLLDLAVKYDIIRQTGSVYQTDQGTSLGYGATFKNNPEFWENGVLEKLNKAIESDLTYSNSKYEELKKEIEATEELEKIATEEELEKLDK